MKCLEFNKILDFIDQKLSKSEAQKVEAHIQQCIKCADQAEWAKGTLSAMKSPSLVDAPEYVIQKAVGIFPKQKAKIADWVLAKLNFDSWMVPEMAGVRSEDAGPRQRIYQTASYKIVLMNEPGRWIGQIVSEREGAEIAGCLIELSSGKKVLRSTVTNENGEFMLLADANKNLQLKIYGISEWIIINGLN
ncbi:MAG TPA: hypothetical protein VLH08_19535 [Acidobacteriota bacterium]|nr:hypothetical protein [Acidobacteriota bacterium]